MGRDKRCRKSFVNIPTHPPLYCKEEEFEGFGLWKEEVQNFVLKSQLSLSLNKEGTGYVNFIRAARERDNWQQ